MITKDSYLDNQHRKETKFPEEAPDLFQPQFFAHPVIIGRRKAQFPGGFRV